MLGLKGVWFFVLVGQALRNNPFAPWVPCHRVVSNDLFVGGFCGAWGSGEKISRKMELLKGEGIEFKDDGFISTTKTKRSELLFDFKNEM